MKLIKIHYPANMSAVARCDDTSVNNAIVSFRGQALTDTPAKSNQNPFTSSSRLPVRKNKPNPLPPSNNSHKGNNMIAMKGFGKENSREIEDDLLTRENTRANTGYKTIKLQTVRVQMTTPKPPSPSSHFRKDIASGLKKPIVTAKTTAHTGKNGNGDGASSTPSPTNARSRRVKFIKEPIDNNGNSNDDECIVREIPYYDTTIPLTSCLKKEQTTRQSKGIGLDDEDLIVVKKLVYPPTPPKSRKKK